LRQRSILILYIGTTEEIQKLSKVICEVYPKGIVSIVSVRFMESINKIILPRWKDEIISRRRKRLSW
jgi:hypothetical protein